MVNHRLLSSAKRNRDSMASQLIGLSFPILAQSSSATTTFNRSFGSPCSLLIDSARQTWPTHDSLRRTHRLGWQLCLPFIVWCCDCVRFTYHWIDGDLFVNNLQTKTATGMTKPPQAFRATRKSECPQPLDQAKRSVRLKTCTQLI